MMITCSLTYCQSRVGSLNPKFLLNVDRCKTFRREGLLVSVHTLLTMSRVSIDTFRLSSLAANNNLLTWWYRSGGGRGWMCWTKKRKKMKHICGWTEIIGFSWIEMHVAERLVKSLVTSARAIRWHFNSAPTRMYRVDREHEKEIDVANQTQIIKRMSLILFALIIIFIPSACLPLLWMFTLLLLLPVFMSIHSNVSSLCSFHWQMSESEWEGTWIMWLLIRSRNVDPSPRNSFYRWTS